MGFFASHIGLTVVLILTAVAGIITIFVTGYVKAPPDKAFIISGGSPAIFFNEPVACAFMVLTIFMVSFPTIKKFYRAAKAKKTNV